MKMRQTLEFDCRTICDGRRCPHLHPNKDMRLARTLKMFICRDKNLVIMAEMKDSGKTTEQILSISPINTCVQMRDLHIKGLAQWADFSIDATGPELITSRWNPPINTL